MPQRCLVSENRTGCAKLCSSTIGLEDTLLSTKTPANYWSRILIGFLVRDLKSPSNSKRAAARDWPRIGGLFDLFSIELCECVQFQKCEFERDRSSVCAVVAR